MTRPIIGIIGRRDKIVSEIEREANVIIYDYMTSLDKENASYIGLITNNQHDFIDEDILNLCDGILMMGGVEIKSYHIHLIKYAISNNIPFLGICQGAQALGLSTLTGAKLIKLDEYLTEINHAPKINSVKELTNIVHKVSFEENSKLYNMFGSSIDVNSHHQYALPRVAEPMKIVGTAPDGVIEAIEHVDPNIFAIGVQWHPENMENMQPLFKEFVNRSRIRKRSKGNESTHLCNVKA
ncbi:MAG: gamma-glutamyl-gamma-aminobutyrate hydrolase family protein [Bacilli bacterium]|nr:gamma-glutamyl-gamma-aminobutyrate hydrolase family protein [Bacilli bacterium]